MSDYSHDLDVTTSPRGGVTVAHIMGNVDTVTADKLLTLLQAAMDDGTPKLVGDFSGVTYTSSAGLRSLLAAMKQARRDGGDFRLAAVTDRVKKVLDLSGFTSILRLYPDVDAAVASFDA
jgi:anti-sigma B factor antagonist